jgi:hypothetical protein
MYSCVPAMCRKSTYRDISSVIASEKHKNMLTPEKVLKNQFSNANVCPRDHLHPWGGGGYPVLEYKEHNDKASP